MANWSKKQSDALRMVAAWMKDPKSPKVFRLFGYAGAGKTTLAKEIAQQSGLSVLYACFTGKAALVLRKKGCAGATTLHSLCYKPVENEVTGEVMFELNHESPLQFADLLIVDEVSMVGEELGADVEFLAKRILVLGDPFQLPPIHGEGYFTDVEPDILLDEVHRQAADNPIIRMSMDVREGRGISLGDYGDSWVRRRATIDRDKLQIDALKADQILCGMNKTRNALNTRMRQLLGFDSKRPMVDERLVCLKNNKTKGLLNGSLWSVLQTGGSPEHPKRIKLQVKSLDEPERRDIVPVDTHIEFFGGDPKENLHWKERKRYDEFDFANALTVHKYQGSQANSVLLFDESSVFREMRDRHLYTGLTRAAEKVMVLV